MKENRADWTLNSVEVALFTGRLACMLASGMPLVRALEVEAASGESSGPVAEALATQTGRGSSFSQSLSLFPQIFGPTYLSLVKVGEETGGLVSALESLAEHLNRQGRFFKRLSGALAYPLCVTAAVGLMLAFLLFYMVPRFAEMYAGNGAKLPGPTALVLFFSKPVFWMPLLVAVTLVVTVFLHLYRTPQGRRNLLDVCYQIPGLGRLGALAVLGRTASSLGLMLAQGLTLTRALRIVRSPSSGWTRLDQALEGTEKSLSESEDLAGAFAHQEIFPNLMVQMVQAGDETGRLSYFLNHYAMMVEEEVELGTETFLQLFEPVLMGVSGLLVAFIVLAAFLPIYHLLNLA